MEREVMENEVGWEHVDDYGEGNEEVDKEEEIDQEALQDVKWNGDNFKEDNFKEDNFKEDDFKEYNFKEDIPGQTRVTVEESVVIQEKIAWDTPSKEQLEELPPKDDQTYSIRKSSKWLPMEGELDGSAGKPVYGQMTTSNVGFGQQLNRMLRESWGAERPGGRGQLRSPISKVRFTQTGTQYCSTHEECMRQCRELQKYYMDLGFPDIPYNFLIGGDGVLYHGRGWMKQADRSPTFQRLRKTCIDVAYIGDFIEKKIPYEMLSTAADFMKFGLKVSKITPFFQSFTFLGESIRS